MASYFDEHLVTNEDLNPPDAHSNQILPIGLARLVLQGGWTEDLGLTFENLFPGKPIGVDPQVLKNLERLTSSQVKDKDGQCLICLECWSSDEPHTELIRLPCGHIFHNECITQWFKKANSCPYCREELPTNDPDYEEYKKQKRRQETRQADVDELHDSMFS